MMKTKRPSSWAKIRIIDVLGCQQLTKGENREIYI